MWGSNARNAHPIFFHHVLEGRQQRRQAVRRRPARRSETAQFADRWLGLHVGTDIALSNTIAREIIHAGLANQDFIARGTSDYDGLRGLGRGLDARARRAGHRSPGRGDPRAGPHLRNGRRRSAVLDARHHRTPQRRRQRACDCAISRCSPARSAVTAPGSARCAGRTTSRAAATWARCPTSCPASRTSSTTSPARSSSRSGASRSPAERRLASHRDVRGDGAWRPPALFVIGENPAQSEADVEARRAPARESRPHGRARHLPHQDRAAGRRRAARFGVVVRGRRHGHQLRAPRAAGAQGPRSAGRGARRHPHPARRGRPSRPRLALRLAEDVWNELRRALADARRHVVRRLEELGGIQWPCYSEDRLEPPFLHGRLWADDPGRPWAPSTVQRRHRRAAGRASSTRSSRCASRPAAGSTRSTPACSRAATAARTGSARRSTCHPRTPRRSASMTARWSRIVSARGTIKAPARIDHGLRPGLVFMTFHFPDESRRQHHHDRRHRPEERHRRVQGDRGADRQDRRVPPRSAGGLSRSPWI